MKVKILLTILTIIFCGFSAQAQTVTSHKNEAEAKKAAGAGVTYKIPAGVMPMQWSHFKGMLMLCEKKPCSIFISYPDENESLEQLKVRAGTALTAMFVHDEAAAKKIEWQTSSVPSHKGDRAETAVLKTFEDSTQILQISYFEREWNGLKFVYGYLGRKDKTSTDKDDSSDLLDSSGSGSKVFDKFWKTLPNK
jgi:hypothetical protein